MTPTVSDIIKISKCAEYLSAQDIALGSLYGAPPQPQLPEIIYTERKSVEWLFIADPNHTDLFGTAEYLLALCGKYGILAKIILNL